MEQINKKKIILLILVLNIYVVVANDSFGGRDTAYIAIEKSDDLASMEYTATVILRKGEKEYEVYETTCSDTLAITLIGRFSSKKTYDMFSIYSSPEGIDRILYRDVESNSFYISEWTTEMELILSISIDLNDLEVQIFFTEDNELGAAGSISTISLTKIWEEIPEYMNKTLIKN